jgi:hypothetical protein
MAERTLDNLSPEEFEQTIDRFIEWAAEWDGALPVGTFRAAWEEIEHRKGPVRITARLSENQLILNAPPGSPIYAEGNRIRLEDGRELIIALAGDPAVPA